MAVMTRQSYLVTEAVLIFVLFPVVLWAEFVPRTYVLIPLSVISLPAILWLGRRYGYNRETFWAGERGLERQQLRVILLRLLVITPLLLLILWFMRPDKVFDLPRQHPLFWLTLLIVYPLLSVYVQEVLFRAFFFRRYGKLIRDPSLLLWSNAVVFSWTHIVFNSHVTLIMTLISGWMFAQTYQKTRSLRLVCLEHALYGDLIFTLGYSEYFIYRHYF